LTDLAGQQWQTLPERPVEMGQVDGVDLEGPCWLTRGKQQSYKELTPGPDTRVSIAPFRETEFLHHLIGDCTVTTGINVLGVPKVQQAIRT
jgi:hypothetical protein